MILGFKSPPGEQPYWFSDEKKFVRVAASICFPSLERPLGCVVVLAELFRAAGPQDITALDGLLRDSPELENRLVQYRRDLKFDHIITEKEEDRDTLFGVSGLTYGLEEIPLVTYAAPAWASGEIGRQRVDKMIEEGRLHLDLVEPILSDEPDQAAKAIQCAVVWMQENKPIYAKPRENTPRYGRVWGTEGL